MRATRCTWFRIGHTARVDGIHNRFVLTVRLLLTFSFPVPFNSDSIGDQSLCTHVNHTALGHLSSIVHFTGSCVLLVGEEM